MAEDHVYWYDSLHVDARVEDVLSRLSLDDKIKLVSGQFIQDRLEAGSTGSGGLPPFNMADGPAGVRRAATSPGEGKATALPAPLALAATWNADLATRYGDVLGAEAAATGHNVLLGPAVDIARAPLGGRTFESFGEEPLLHMRLAVAEVQAIQRHGVQASLKHFILNNQEHARNSINVFTDERALHEVYLPPFEAALRLGQAASVMASYNRADGIFLCDHRQLLNDVLRGTLGFRGWVISDFGANHSTAASANAGLDWELTFAPKWGDTLHQAVQAGEVNRERLDEMVRSILRPTIGLGMRAPVVDLGALDADAHDEVALEVARQAVVLLRNDQDQLPWQADTLRRVAVIGVDADTATTAGGGSAFVRPLRPVSVLEGLRTRLGPDVEVGFTPGTDPIGPGALLPGLPPVPSDVMTPEGGEPGEGGFRMTYWNNPEWDGTPLGTHVNAVAELNRGFFDLPDFQGATPKLMPLPGDLGLRPSFRWTGILTASTTGEYTFALTCVGTGRVFLGDEQLIEVLSARPIPTTADAEWDGTGAQVVETTCTLTAGQAVRVQVDYAVDAPEQYFLYGAQVRLGWRPPAGTLTPAVEQAARLAREADVAVVIARTFESEAMDRPHLRLPNDQERLILAVASANPRTVVVLMSGGPIDTTAWETQVPAVLEAWYGGQAQGRAVAEVLLGDVNPSGKLPITFPMDDAATPLTSAAQYPGQDGTVHYTEGVNVGYRGYDALGLEPRYPFGFGLSYTTFAYANLTVSPQQHPTDPITVAFNLTNTGTRAGTEVTQLYLKRSGQTQKLAGWARIPLAAGERRRVEITLHPDSLERPFSTWEPETQRWEVISGRWTILVGSSARDLPLRGTLEVPTGQIGTVLAPQRSPA
ncbi:glycoside hydrolase family 3 protein [Deinococcus sp. QL22]|uniref:beta-glucosidase n=1 Tax=Deinococcus sp. QL22 TaxID=2939437 RepID=UPI002016F37A|nr:glycoside hydrolase family 3 C-terminal domain-containing protein [Deinococcus sp. QL22]UQN09160.1 glycoside hydrolase family 3 C-terminal domain-containing protein [Deinococcus sp. QL22]